MKTMSNYLIVAHCSADKIRVLSAAENTKGDNWKEKYKPEQDIIRSKGRRKDESSCCVLPLPSPCHSPAFTLIKKKRKFPSYIRKFRVEQLQSHI
jgi:hypothetical protein